MTDPHPTPHRATDENWQLIRERADRLGYASDRAICDMADTLAALERRVEALEAPAPAAAPAPGATLHSHSVGEAKPIEDWGKGHIPAAAAPSTPAGSLVEVVASAIGASYLDDMNSTKPEARAAIAAVAAWLEQDDRECDAVQLLRREAGR